MIKPINEINETEDKKKVSLAAINYLKSGMTLGIGSGSTINEFVKLLHESKKYYDLKAIVCASIQTTRQAESLSIKTETINNIGYVDLYIDSADEINDKLELIKGKGGASTIEKLLVKMANQFICIATNSKLVKNFSHNSIIPIEVIKDARSYVAREIVKLGGIPEYRIGYETDNGNYILDVRGLNLTNPVDMEIRLNAITGVVENGIFALKTPELCLIQNNTQTQILKRQGK